MSFLKPLVMTTKKKFKFQVTILIDELNAVPFVTGVLYCKLRLKNGTYTDNTPRENVENHCVYWRQRFEFSCKMSADPSTGILDPCLARLSVRKEVRGGRSSNKIGFVDLNLAEFAGSNQTCRHCLLEGYDDKIRLDNSILKIVVGMQLSSGDPLFKVPTVQRDVALKLPNNSPDMSTPARDGDSSGFGSLSRKPRVKRNDVVDSFEPGHSRNASSISQRSKRSDYSSQHSRTPSNLSQSSNPLDTITETDSAIASTGIKSPQKLSSLPKMPPPRPPPPHSNTVKLTENRMGDTRVCADDVVNKLIESQDFTRSSVENDNDNLQLFVASDGSTALGGQALHNRVGSGVYHPVVFESSVSQRTGFNNILN